MRTVSLAIVLAIVASSAALAEPGEMGIETSSRRLPWPWVPSNASLPSEIELIELLRQAGEMPLAEVTVADLNEVVSLIADARREEQFVARATGLSLLVPGLGHYSIGSRGRAWGYFAADVFIRGTATVIAYVLLPAPVKFANLNYLQTPVSDIESRWNDLAPGEYVPAVAVSLSGSILSAVVRQMAARDARAVATEAVRSGAADLGSAGLGGRR